MSSRLSFVFILAFLVGLPHLVISQDRNSLKLISYREEGRVLLRWAPTSSVGWLELNERGYSLARFTIIRDSARVYPPELKTLSTSLKPVSITEWQKASIDNKYAAIAAQAIYGDSFQAETGNDEESVIQLIQLAKEQDMRYSFTILSADQSFEVAQLAGLGFEDNAVKENEIYLYKLFGNNGLHASDTVYNYVDLFDGAQLPQVQDVSADFQDRMVTLSWRSDYYIDTYTSYLVEKSMDGKYYQPIDDLGTITASQNQTEPGKWMMKTDSLAGNNMSFYYRIRGKTPFGIIGPPSEVVVGSGRKDFQLSIGITNALESIDGIDVIWTIDGQSLSQIDKILIERSANSIDYQILDSLAVGANNYQDLSPESSNYYRVIAKDAFGGEVSSMPYFVQTHDSIPPSIPTGLIGFADTTGQVSLNWQRNNEIDIAGYRVFRSRVINGAYRQVTVKAIKDTIYHDMVELITLSRKVYYKIVAVDHRGNMSELSSETLIELPDLIPPVPPRITGYRIIDSGVALSWINSSSSDVDSTKILRKTTDSLTCLITISNSNGIATHIDSTINNGIVAYYLVALDDAGNESEKSNIVKVESHVNHGSLDVQLIAKADRRRKIIKLSWEAAHEALEYRVYKSKNDEPISLYKVFEGNINGFEDNLLEVNSVYHYRVQMLNQKEGSIVFSKQIDIVY